MTAKPLILIMTALCSTLLVGCGESQQQNASTEVKARPVKILTIEHASELASQSYPAVIDAVQTSRLAFQVGGKLEQLKVIEAQEVMKGDVLARLEQRDFVNQLNSAKAQYQAAQRDYQRAVTLSKDGVVSASDLDQLLTKRDVAKAQYDSAEKALSDSVLVAPYDALVVDVPVKALENVSPGTAVVTLMGRGQMEAMVNIPASIIATASEETNPSAEVLLDAAPNNPIVATFRRANLEADPTTQTYQVNFAFTPPSNLMVLPGMNATVKITALNRQADLADAVSVPVHAILSEADKQYVWLVDPKTMQVSKKQVIVEQGIGETLLVTQGLENGDMIAAAGAAFLTSGMLVRSWTKP